MLSVYCNKFMFYLYVQLNYFIYINSCMQCVLFVSNTCRYYVFFHAIFFNCYFRWTDTRFHGVVGPSGSVPVLEKRQALHAMPGQVCLLCIALQIVLFCKAGTALIVMYAYALESGAQQRGVYRYKYPQKSVTVLFTCGPLTHVLQLQ